MNACRTCDAKVFWAKTATGKAILIDSVPVPDGNIQILEDRGELIALVTLGDYADRPRYKAHFATCQFAELHRRPRASGMDRP